MFYEIKASGSGLRKSEDHPERNYNPNRMIDTAKAAEIIFDCAQMGVSGMQFTGGGEPTVHKDFKYILGYAQQRIQATSLVTNGVLVGKKFEEWKDELLGLSWIRFSLDAARMETYTKVRNVPDWHFTSAVAGIRELRRARDEAGRGPVIGVGFVITPENWQEVYEAAELAKNLGADNIRIGAQFSADDEKRFESFHNDCARLCRQAEALTDKGFTVFNRFSEKMDDLRQKAPEDQLCGYQYFTTYIGADLNVYRCCTTAYNQQGLIGSLKDQRFADLWMSQQRADEMATFDARSCERCQFHNILKVTNYALAVHPKHCEFV